MTLDEWISAQPGYGSRGSPAARDGSMCSAEFATFIGDPELGIPTRQAVDLWRKRRRKPSPDWLRQIIIRTDGAVTEAEMETIEGRDA
jgi:hypothetical protein